MSNFSLRQILSPPAAITPIVWIDKTAMPISMLNCPGKRDSHYVNTRRKERDTQRAERHDLSTEILRCKEMHGPASLYHDIMEE